MSRIFIFLSMLFITLMPQQSFANSGAQGYWLTENKRAVIHVQPCDDSVCGNIYWIIEGGMLFDDKNPDPRVQGLPMCGLELLHGFEKHGQDWKNGKIYKADEGETYEANITVKNENTLMVRGYIGMPLFGKTQTWKRVSSDDYAQCTEPKL
tara:strand:+ start:126 stop:581 length:456 start_codon:yes stop_codon:yes gene_type:complete